MSTESARQVVRRWILGIWDEGDFGLMDELAAPGYTYSTPDQAPIGGKDFRGFVSSIRSAFPDLENTIEEQVAEGDTVVTRGVTRGTHEGRFGDLEATGRTVSVPWVIFTRFEGDEIADDWELYDAAGLLEQLESGS